MKWVLISGLLVILLLLLAGCTRGTIMDGDGMVNSYRQISQDEAKIQNSWTFTRLAKIENVTGEELRSVLGEGDVTVSFWLEWSE